jgi:CheY-like chemotaxis protein
MNNKPRKVNFIIVDDSELDCFIAEKLVKHSGISNAIKSFLQASDALDYIKNSPNMAEDTVNMILLDLLMPMMSGIEFVEEFETLPAEIQNRYIIIAFTSSMNQKDMNRMKSFNSVKHLFNKPLSPEILQPLLQDYNIIP